MFIFKVPPMSIQYNLWIDWSLSIVFFVLIVCTTVENKYSTWSHLNSCCTRYQMSMLNIMKNILSNYQILKFIFVLLTAYLLIQEIEVFLFKKPTFTSIAKVSVGKAIFSFFYWILELFLLDSDHFPVITICAFPSFVLGPLNRFGYQSSFDYSIGVTKDNVLRWGFIYSGGHQHLQQWKTSISPSNVALNTNPGTVLKSACPEGSKTPPT